MTQPLRAYFDRQLSSAQRYTVVCGSLVALFLTALVVLPRLYTRGVAAWTAKSAGFMPHGYCYTWDASIVWLHVLSDGLIALSYFCIPLALVYLARRRRDLPFNWIFWMFGLFIVGCGTTHGMEIWTVWHASYLLAGVVKAITAVVSVATAVMLLPLLPKVIALPSGEQLCTVNDELRVQVVERERVEHELRETMTLRERTLSELEDRKVALAELEVTQGLLQEGVAIREQALKELADHKFALDQHAIVATTDVQGTITYVNDKFCAISKYSKEELLGQNHRILNSGYHPKEFFQQMYQTIANGNVWRDEICNRAKDGSIYWVDTTVVPFLDAHSKPRQYMAIRADITERKRAEEVRERLAAVVDSSDDAIISKTLEGTITAWNRGAERMFGYRASEAVGQSMLMLLPPERAGEEPEILARIGRGESLEHFETVRVRKDGRKIDISATISPIRDGSGAIGGISKIARDITDNKRAEQALKDSLATSEAALKELADQKFALDQHAIVAVTDVQGTITYVNDKFCTISQYSNDELIGQNHRILNSGRHPKEFFQEMYRTIGGGKVWQGEIKNRAKDGSTYWVDTTVVPMLTAEGKPRQYVAIRADITERKLAEELLETQAAELEKTRDELEIRVEERTVDLANANKVLERSNDELQQFAYVASHDLQEPLRMVASYTQLLGQRYKGRLDIDADEFIAFAVDGCNRMQGLIRDLLAYSRAGTNGKALRKISSEAALTEALTSLRGAIEQSGATVTHDLLPAIKTDEMQLTQVLQNLVGNAIKYHGAAVPLVHVSVSKTPANEWVFSVRDNGLGIEKQYFERIFILFQRLHGREEFEGTGIGLAICKKIVEQLGGRIWLESQPGKGSTFYFALPEMEEE
jgi:PAS domain S-box-containing protein